MRDRPRMDRQHPVVVVSALAKVTDALLKAASLAAAGDESGTIRLLNELQVRPKSVSRELRAAVVTKSTNFLTN